MITPAYHMVSLDAKTGRPDPAFGQDGVVDLREEFGPREVDIDNDPLGSSSPPVIVGDVAVVGTALPSGSSPPKPDMPPGHVRGYDVRTGERLWIFHTIPQEGEFGNDTWLDGSWRNTGKRGRLDPVLGGSGARLRIPAHRSPDGRLLRRPPPRRQPLLAEPGVPGRAHRRARVALPDGAPRHLGLRSARAPHPPRHQRGRAHHSGGGAGHQAGVHLRLRPLHGRAGVAHRGAAGGAQRGARRVDRPHPAVPHPPRPLRPPGRVGGRPHRLHPGAARGGARHGLPAGDRAALHPALGHRSGRPRRHPGHAGAARVAGRRQLARRIRRCGDGHPVRHLGHVAVRARAHQRPGDLQHGLHLRARLPPGAGGAARRDCRSSSRRGGALQPST